MDCIKNVEETEDNLNFIFHPYHKLLGAILRAGTNLSFSAQRYSVFARSD